MLQLVLAAVIPSLPAVSGGVALAPAAVATMVVAVAPGGAEDAENAAPIVLPAMANDDPDDDGIVAPPDPVEGCHEDLEAAGVQFSPSRIPVHKNKGGAFLCGAEQVVRYSKGPGKIRWRGSPKVACGMALALARFESAIQEEAEREFGVRVAKIVHMGTYNCREMAAYPGWVSEHSYANALDIKTFVLTNGREVTVRHGWKTLDVAQSESKSRAKRRAAQDARFLRAVAHRAFDEDHFSVVLTPNFDAAHRSHFHLDLARYRVDGTTP
ncbi:MAG: extensin family protein [Myxococcota bacterium]